MIQAINRSRGIARLLALCLCLTMCLAFVGQTRVEAFALVDDAALLVMAGIFILVSFGVITVTQAQQANMQTAMHQFIEGGGSSREDYLSRVQGALEPNAGGVLSKYVFTQVINLTKDLWEETKTFISSWKTWVDTALTPGSDGSYGFQNVGDSTLVIDPTKNMFWLNGVPFNIGNGISTSMQSQGEFSAAKVWVGMSGMTVYPVAAIPLWFYASYSGTTMYIQQSTWDGYDFTIPNFGLSDRYMIGFIWNPSDKLFKLAYGTNGVWNVSIREIGSSFQALKDYIDSQLSNKDITQAYNSADGATTYDPVFNPVDDPSWVNLPDTVQDFFDNNDNMPIGVPDGVSDVLDGTKDTWPIPADDIAPAIDVNPDLVLPDEVTDAAGEGVQNPDITGIADDVGSINDALTGTGTIDFSPITEPLGALVTLFPFCIPWDIAYAVTQFNGSGTAPSWTVPIGVGTELESEITVDLEEFDDIARMVRMFMLLLWIAGLIVLTSAVIKW